MGVDILMCVISLAIMIVLIILIMLIMVREIIEISHNYGIGIILHTILILIAHKR